MTMKRAAPAAENRTRNLRFRQSSHATSMGARSEVAAVCTCGKELNSYSVTPCSVRSGGARTWLLPSTSRSRDRRRCARGAVLIPFYKHAIFSYQTGAGHIRDSICGAPSEAQKSFGSTLVGWTGESWTALGRSIARTEDSQQNACLAIA